MDKNEIWVGTLGNGLFHCADRNCAPVKINFRNLSIHSIHKPNEGNLWIGSNNKLIKTEYLKDNDGNIAVKKVTSFGTNNGLPSNYIKDIESKEDTLWIGTDNGLALMPLCDNNKLILPPKLDIKSVKFNNRYYTTSEERYQVPNNLNDLKIEFVAISSDKPIFPEYTYRYKVIKDGSTKTNWTNTNSRSVELSNQLFGKYTFTIQGQNSYGIWSNPVDIKYEILPHFTQPLWFRLGILGLLALAGILFYKLRTLQLKKDSLLNCD